MVHGCLLRKQPGASQFAYANSPAIRRLDRGQLQVTRARLQRSNRTIKTRRSYTNKAGRLCYQGTKELKSTETLDYNTYIYIYIYVSLLLFCEYIYIYTHHIMSMTDDRSRVYISM